MNAATITQAQNEGLRHQSTDLFATVRSFCEQLFTAHGGWFARNDDATARKEMLALAAESEAHSPNLAAELRYFANR